MFARRTSWSLASNRLAAAVEARRRSGKRILDLTLSNPTRAEIAYPEREIAEALSLESPQFYEPDPKGDPAARLAISCWYERRGFEVDPERILLTPGTSESYAWIFKLLCDPGDSVLVPRPSYPLFEYLATLESIESRHYPLRYDSRWEIDREALAEMRLESLGGAPDSGRRRESCGGYGQRVEDRLREEQEQWAPGPRFEPADIGAHVEEHHAPLRRRPEGSSLATSVSRALVVVNPNNPTGSYLSRSEVSFLSAFAREEDLVLVSDEVFSSFPLEADPGTAAPFSLLGSDDAPALVLDGLSKSAGLPGMKAGWIVVLGPAGFRAEALSRLEVIADTYLSVGSVVQRALPRLIELGEEIALQVRSRIRSNLDHLRSTVPAGSSCEALRVEGGWSAVLRVPRKIPDEDLCLELIEEDGVLAQPGWFFDFESEGYLVVSLLTPGSSFREGLSRILSRAR